MGRENESKVRGRSSSRSRPGERPAGIGNWRKNKGLFTFFCLALMIDWKTRSTLVK
jgi:hypothetical protein